MMKWLKQILIALLAVLGIMAVIGLLLPSSVHVERSIDIAAPTERVFPLLNDLREFNRWSPWARIDPDAVHDFSDPSAGDGAWMTWTSDNPSVGSGKMRVTESLANQKVSMELDFGPQGTANASLAVESRESTSRVTWSFEEDLGLNPVARYFGLMLDGLIGPEFDKGLANLKDLAETP